jgi:2-C-methyl-D-erythritol 2,4-cyclodiphosphate synthase
MTGRIGHGWDRHRLETGRRMVLGGLEVPDAPAGPVGHSDGDAVLHALTDALLGAAGRGDIGEHFPDTEPSWQGASSGVFVRRAMELVREAGLGVANADVTVLLERPRLTPVKGAMRDAIAALLGVPGDRVSVKAKSGEGIGPVGRGEAVEAHAVVLLEEP